MSNDGIPMNFQSEVEFFFDKIVAGGNTFTVLLLYSHSPASPPPDLCHQWSYYAPYFTQYLISWLPSSPGMRGPEYKCEWPDWEKIISWILLSYERQTNSLGLF